MWPRGERPEVAVSCRTYDEWIEMVAAGRGVGVLPESARQRPHPAVRYIALADAPPVSLVLVRPAARATRSATSWSSSRARRRGAGGAVPAPAAGPGDADVAPGR